MAASDSTSSGLANLPNSTRSHLRRSSSTTSPPPGDDARAELLASILLEFERELVTLYDPETSARRWEERAGLPGVPYRFAIDGEGEIEAQALRIASGGGLVVQNVAGERTIDLAEARVIRPRP